MATAISADGLTIVGTGISPTGDVEAWLARLELTVAVTEPITLDLMGIGALVLG